MCRVSNDRRYAVSDRGFNLSGPVARGYNKESREGLEASSCRPRDLGFPFAAALLPLAISPSSSWREVLFLLLGIVMEAGLRGKANESSCPDISFANQDIQRCPFLRNIHQPTSFSFSAINFSVPVRGHGPIFEDGPNFDNAFRLFHGRNGVVPLSGRTFVPDQKPEPEISPEFNPLAAKAATISLSAFGPGGPFGFDFFSNKWKKQNGRSSNSQKRGDSTHESQSNEWLETGQCPIAKSYRAVSAVLPLVADALKPPPSMKLRCPPVVVAARAALARTSFVKNLRPQPLPAKVLAIALLGMAANVPLGVWREHTKKFSPQWVIAVHAAVPFIGMLRKSVLMPKAAMAITIAASILGQTIGSRAERIRLKAAAAAAAASDEGNPVILKTRTLISAQKTGQCSPEVAWDPLSLKPRSLNSPAPSICY